MDKMFCYQCQETAKGTGCTTIGICGKDAETSGLQDLLIHTDKGVAAYSSVLRKNGKAKELIEGKVNLIDKILKKVYSIDYYTADYDHYCKERNMFMKTLFYKDDWKLKEITIKYIKNTNNIIEIIYLK